MGHIIKLKPSSIRPSQDFLKRGTMDFIFDCYKRGDLASSPPPHLVRRDPNKEGLYIAIDGHNLLAAYEFFDTECEVFLVDSPTDFLPNPDNNPSILQRNKDLAEKFKSCVEEKSALQTSFSSMIKNFL